MAFREIAPLAQREKGVQVAHTRAQLAVRQPWIEGRDLKIPARQLAVRLEVEPVALADPSFSIDVWIEGSADGGATWVELARAGGWTGGSVAPNDVTRTFLRPGLIYANTHANEYTELRVGWEQSRGARVRAAINEVEVVYKADAHHSIAVDAVSSSATDSGTSLSWSHTCAGSDRYLSVGMGMDDVSVPFTFGATYNSVSMSNLGEDNGSNARVALFGLVAPATGANTIALSSADSGRIAGGGVSCSGVGQSTPIGTVVTNNGADLAPTVSVSSAIDELVIDVVVGDEGCTGDGTLTEGAGQTRRVHQNTATSCGIGLAMSTEAGASSVTMSWTWDKASDWAIVAVPLKPAAAGGQPTTKRFGGVPFMGGHGAGFPSAVQRW